jgi:GMP synthase (glutamine-hydrolysing)
MNDLRIALLNAAHDGTETGRNFHREVDADLVEYDVTEGELPRSLEFDACIVTGSRASVHWDRPWIAELEEWVGSAVRRGLPLLGICFGHRLLADVLGGAIEHVDEYEIGYRRVEHHGESPLFEGVEDRFTVFTSHADRVTRLPPGARRIARNEYGIHGFRKDDVFAVQFHPEYDTAMAERVTRDKDELPGETRRRVLDGIDDAGYAAAREATAVFDDFLAYVRDRRDGEGRDAEDRGVENHDAAGPTAVTVADD